MMLTLFTLSSIAFSNMQEMPAKYTCVAEDVSPPLEWQNIPDGTVSLALIVDDPDAPDPNAPKMTWVHWVLYNINPDIHALPEAANENNLPNGAIQGINDWKNIGYGGPCPPIGRHRYFFKLYALDKAITDKSLTKPQLEAAMKGHIIAQTSLVGTFKK